MKNTGCSGTRLDTKDLVSLLPDILVKLAEVIFEYTTYPSSAHLSQDIGGPDQKRSLPQRTRVIQWLLRLDSTTEIQD